MKQWLAEPSLHFLVLGAALFGLYALAGTDAQVSGHDRLSLLRMLS